MGGNRMIDRRIVDRVFLIEGTIITLIIRKFVVSVLLTLAVLSSHFAIYQALLHLMPSL
jgi:hypothetical protein